MYKQHLLQNIEREYVLLKQIIPLIEEKDLSYRQSEKVRSTLELMQYLSTIGTTMLRWFILNDLTKEEFAKLKAYRETLTIADFSERLDKQFEEVKRYFDMFSEEDLYTKEVELPSKEKMILGIAIINCPIKWLATYRMQLFFNLKASGNHAISTKEAWTITA